MERKTAREANDRGAKTQTEPRPLGESHGMASSVPPPCNSARLISVFNHAKPALALRVGSLKAVPEKKKEEKRNATSF